MNNLADLYLSVKIRKEDDINIFDKDKLLNEKKKLLGKNVGALTLIEYVRQSVEVLVDLHNA